MTTSHPTPRVAYRWRAVTGDAVTLSAEGTVLYDDDRPGWTGSRTRSDPPRSTGTGRTSRSRGNSASSPATRPMPPATCSAGPRGSDRDLRLRRARGVPRRRGTRHPGVGGRRHLPVPPHGLHVAGRGIESFLRTTIAHEVTHVVFHDASDNPFHAPATWLNEGVATWSEVGNAETPRRISSSPRPTARDGLMAFEALTDQFPIDARGASTGYAQGATMVDHIISTYGPMRWPRSWTPTDPAPPMSEAIEAGTGSSSMTSAPSTSPRSGSRARTGRALPLGRSDVPLAGSGGTRGGAVASTSTGGNGWFTGPRVVAHHRLRGGRSGLLRRCLVARAPTRRRARVHDGRTTRPATGCAIRPGWILSIALALGALGFVAAAQWNSEVQRTSYTTSAQQALAAQAWRSSRSRSCSGPARRGESRAGRYSAAERGFADLTGRGERAAGRDAPGGGPDPRSSGRGS